MATREGCRAGVKHLAAVRARNPIPRRDEVSKNSGKIGKMWVEIERGEDKQTEQGGREARYRPPGYPFHRSETMLAPAVVSDVSR